MEMAASVHSTVSKSRTMGTCFYADIHTVGERLHILMSMNKDPIASQHRSKRIGPYLFVRKLKERCNATVARFVVQVGIIFLVAVEQ